jgi:hypothetical protein
MAFELPAPGRYAYRVVNTRHHQWELNQIVGPAAGEHPEHRCVASLVFGITLIDGPGLIRVYIEGFHIGQIADQDSLPLRSWLRRSGHARTDMTCPAVIRGVHSERDGYFFGYGVWIDLPDFHSTVVGGPGQAHRPAAAATPAMRNQRKAGAASQGRNRPFRVYRDPRRRRRQSRPLSVNGCLGLLAAGAFLFCCVIPVFTAKPPAGGAAVPPTGR